MKNLSLIFVVGLLLVGCANEERGGSSSMVRIAKKARQSGNSEAAISFYNKAIAMEPNNSEAYLGLAESYLDMKLLDAAAEYIKKAENAGGKLARAAYLRGKIFLLSGDNCAAEKEFRKSISLADSMNALGAVLDGRGEHAKAQEMYKKVIAKDPDYIDAYNNMGLSMILDGRYKDAVFYLENACSLPSVGVTHRSNLAIAYGLSGDVDKARETYAHDFEGDELEEKLAYLEDVIAAKSQ
ncbi:MAG: tetratricopeptide repeat protein [Holosporaceae bacterium]|jgi:Flp pilus assembly protein TadD|nr:tetratricopeptide repeat protein [Holosporaceae bacterium]